MIQAVGRCYVGYFNFTLERTGTLWEGRYKSCLVDSGAYVLNCYRYIELNPVRAGIVASPDRYAWSSFHHNGSGRPDPLISTHSAYSALGGTHAEQAVAYRALVAAGCDRREADEIRAMTSQHRAFGGANFRRELEAAHVRPMGVVKRGRPAKAE
jgi:putative transposase